MFDLTALDGSVPVALQHVVFVRQLPVPKHRVRGQRHSDDGYRAEQHRKRPEREQLRPGLFVEKRELDDRREPEDGLTPEHTDGKAGDEARDAAVAVGAGHPQDERELREEDDVHEVRAEDEEAVDGGGEDGEERAHDPDGDDGNAQDPLEFSFRCLVWMRREEKCGNRLT